MDQQHPFLRLFDTIRPTRGVHGTTTLCIVMSKRPVARSSLPASRYSIPAREKKYKHTVYGFNLKREYFYCRDLKLSGPHMKEICQHDSLGLNCPDVNYKAECFC